jgi:hypothetical protein
MRDWAIAAPLFGQSRDLTAHWSFSEIVFKIVLGLMIGDMDGWLP